MTLGEVLEDYITAEHPVENITICVDKLHRVSYENALIHSLGKPSYKKNGKKKRTMSVRGGRGGLPHFMNFSLILPGPQITWKWTMHTDKLTTKCHICLHT